MQFDFAIMSLPRSGSHMLMSALHSHPNITMVGEVGMVEKFPLPASEGGLRGCIVPSYRLPSVLFSSTPVIFLLRDLGEIDNSPYHQHLAPVEYFDSIPPKSRMSYLIEQRQLMNRFMLEHIAGQYVVTYDELCGGKDVRELGLSAELCCFLNVSERPLQPLTYKPVRVVSNG